LAAIAILSNDAP
jgi:hypothetical protein